MMTGTLSLEISATSRDELECILTFIICYFLDLCFAETNRTPFDLKCESELIGGYHTEYSSMKMGFIYLQIYNMFISSTILAVLFFGDTTIQE
jgi:NADH-quinone oxidoreductase subunit H